MVGIISLRLNFINEEEKMREFCCPVLLVVLILVKQSVSQDSRVGSVKLLRPLYLFFGQQSFGILNLRFLLSIICFFV